MKWIADADERKIREARAEVEDEGLSDAYNLLTDVLGSIHARAQEQPHPEPRIVELSEAEMRRIYPKRFPQ